MATIGRLVKASAIEEIGEQLSQRPNFFVATVNRLSAPDTDALRQKLFASKCRLVMVKRRLGLRVIEPLKISGLAELLEGSVGFVLAGEDILQPAKQLVEFRKGHEEQLILRGALIDGRLWDTRTIEELAKLPPKPILLAQVVATIESPITDLIMTIEQLIGDLAWVMEQAATKAGTPPAGGVAAGSPDAVGDGAAKKPPEAPPTEEGTPS